MKRLAPLELAARVAVLILMTAVLATTGCKDDDEGGQQQDETELRPVDSLFAQGPIAMPTPASALSFGMTRREAAEAWPAATGGELKLTDYGRDVALEPMFGGMGATHEFLRKVYLTVPAEKGLETAVARWGEPDVVTWARQTPPPDPEETDEDAGDDDAEHDDTDGEADDDEATDQAADATEELPEPGVEYRYWFDEGSGLRVLARPDRNDPDVVVFVFSPWQTLEDFIGSGRGANLGFEEQPIIGQHFEALTGTFGQRFGTGSYRGQPWGRLHLPPVGYAESEVVIDMQVHGDEIVSYDTALGYANPEDRDRIFDALRKRFGNPSDRGERGVKRYRSSPIIEALDDPGANRVRFAIGREL